MDLKPQGFVIDLDKNYQYPTTTPHAITLLVMPVEQMVKTCDTSIWLKLLKNCYH
ncbi:hypothetical protein HOLleu_33764 [Holothuria leucospilota]|uniref:Uncharacterized protein n=1 Tax=Holothuria leucospilota TaxID=206669 RepID=A0A9Q0YP77_HOLLE|nr:hypothetical protein HOLleu_33764 [Holothuria leucospilota]